MAKASTDFANPKENVLDVVQRSSKVAMGALSGGFGLVATPPSQIGQAADPEPPFVAESAFPKPPIKSQVLAPKSLIIIF